MCKKYYTQVRNISPPSGISLSNFLVQGLTLILMMVVNQSTPIYLSGAIYAV